MNYLFYGLVIAVVNFAYGLLLFFLGFQTEKLQQGNALGWIVLIITIVGLFWAMNSAKGEAEEEGKAFGYGKSFGSGAMTVLWMSIFGAILSFVHLQFINVDYVDYVIENQEQQLIDQGMSDEQIEQIGQGTRAFMQPWIMTAMAFVWSLVSGMILALIIAIFVRGKGSEVKQV